MNYAGNSMSLVHHEIVLDILIFWLVSWVFGNASGSPMMSEKLYVIHLRLQRFLILISMELNPFRLTLKIQKLQKNLYGLISPLRILEATRKLYNFENHLNFEVDRQIIKSILRSFHIKLIRRFRSLYLRTSLPSRK